MSAPFDQAGQAQTLRQRLRNIWESTRPGQNSAKSPRSPTPGKIGREEHFAVEETVNDSSGFVPGDYWVELRARLLDIHENRLRQIDAHGMEMMLLSLNAPTV